MEVKIILSREKKYWRYGAGDRVEGKLIVHNTQPVFTSGIRVSLETIVKVNFRDADGRSITKTENAMTPCVYVYVFPINWSWAQLSGKFDDERQACLPPSKHVFPFNFYYPQTLLPGTFCSEYGSVKHQVAAYLMTPTKNHLLATHILNFADYLNLFQDPVALKPLKLEKRKKSLMFSLVHPSSSSPLHFTLNMPQRGHLPGEYANFKLTLINLTGKSLSCVVLSLIQKVSYNAQRCKKTLGSVLDEIETVEVDSAVETIWESGITIPCPLKPTFYKGLIEHQYFIKVQIFSKGNSRPMLKAHVPIIIGTTREIEGHVMYREGSSTTRYVSRSRRTEYLRGSMDELTALECSNTVSSPPPPYSQLSSRAASIDNFLPLYEDAMQGRTRSGSDAAGSSGSSRGHRKKLVESKVEKLPEENTQALKEN